MRVPNVARDARMLRCVSGVGVNDARDVELQVLF